MTIAPQPQIYIGKAGIQEPILFVFQYLIWQSEMVEMVGRILICHWR